jgi:hypothetical protein
MSIINIKYWIGRKDGRNIFSNIRVEVSEEVEAVLDEEYDRI